VEGNQCLGQSALGLLSRCVVGTWLMAGLVEHLAFSQNGENPLVEYT